MILTGKITPSLKVKQIRKFHAAIAEKLNKKSFHPVAQRKLKETFESLSAVVAEADDAIAELGERPAEEGPTLTAYKTAVNSIEGSAEGVIGYQIDTATEWTTKNTTRDMLDLSFMLDAIEEG